MSKCCNTCKKAQKRVVPPSWRDAFDDKNIVCCPGLVDWAVDLHHVGMLSEFYACIPEPDKFWCCDHEEGEPEVIENEYCEEDEEEDEEDEDEEDEDGN